MLEDAGHFVFVERFADVNRVVVRSLRSGAAGTRGTGGGSGDRAVGEALPEAEGWLWRSTGAVRVWVARAMATMWGFLGFRD